MAMVVTVPEKRLWVMVVVYEIGPLHLLVILMEIIEPTAYSGVDQSQLRILVHSRFSGSHMEVLIFKILHYDNNRKCN